MEYLEASRSRRLVELMIINDIYQQKEKPPEVEEMAMATPGGNTNIPSELIVEQKSDQNDNVMR